MKPADESLADEIQALLCDMPDAYPDFVRYAPTEAVLEGLGEELLDYLRENDGLMSSDVLEWIVEKAGWEEN